mgnify:FL=1
MSSVGFIRNVAIVAAAAGIVGTGAVTACSKEKPAETTPSTSAPSVSPTEKYYN